MDETTSHAFAALRLREAVEDQDIDALRALLGASTPPDSRGARARSPMAIAAGLGWTQGMQALAAAGARVDEFDGHDQTPLMFALEKRQEQAASWLLAHGADPNAATREGDRPLAMAAKRAMGPAMRDLIQAGADVDARDSREWTALLHVASTYTEWELFEILIGAGADVDARNDVGQSAMYWAHGIGGSEHAQRVRARAQERDLGRESPAAPRAAPKRI